MIEMNQRKLCEENCFVCNYETVSDEEREEYIQDRYNENVPLLTYTTDVEEEATSEDGVKVVYRYKQAWS